MSGKRWSDIVTSTTTDTNSTAPRRKEKCEKALFETTFFSDSKIIEIECVFGDAAPAYYERLVFQILHEGGPIRYQAAVAMLRCKQIGERAEEFIKYCIEVGLFYLSDNLISSARADREINALRQKREKWRKDKGVEEDSEPTPESIPPDSTAFPSGIHEGSEKEEGQDPPDLFKKNDTPKKPPRAAPTKLEIEPGVWLTEAELEKFQAKHGEPFIARCCEKLSGWIGQIPDCKKRIKNGKNAGATFRAWVINSVYQEQASIARTNSPPPLQAQRVMQANLDMISRLEAEEREG